MTTTLIETVTRELAKARGVHPTELDTSLEEQIDTGALERLIDHEGSTWWLGFEVDHNVVLVRSDGEVTVEERTGTSRPPRPSDVERGSQRVSQTVESVDDSSANTE